MKIVTNLVQVDAKKMKWNHARWFDQIEKLRNKVLLVIDDINNRQQFDELVPDLKELNYIKLKEIQRLSKSLHSLRSGVTTHNKVSSLCDVSCQRTSNEALLKKIKTIQC